MRIPPEIIKVAERKIESYCAARVTPEIRDQIRLEAEVDGPNITLVERRPPWDRKTNSDEWTRSPIARFCFDTLGEAWALEWSDSDGVWHPFTMADASEDVSDLLEAVDEDATCIFWG